MKFPDGYRVQIKNSGSIPAEWRNVTGNVYKSERSNSLYKFFPDDNKRVAAIEWVWISEDSFIPVPQQSMNIEELL